MTALPPEETSGSPDGPTPRVSIGLPLYNAERYLAQTLDSILGQGFEDFELIVSDNASQDRTAEMVRTRVAEDPRIRFFALPENRGAAANYNLVLEAARAGYFKWQAYDDLLDKRFLARCVEALDEAPDDVVLVYPRTRIIDTAGRVLEDYDDRLDLQMARPSERLGQLIRNLTLSNAIFGLMRKAALLRTRRHGAFNEADRVTLAELALEGRFKELPDALFLRRMHPEVSTARTRSAGEIAAWFDPSKGSRRILGPKTRLFAEHLVAIGRSGLPSGEKLRCLAVFLGASLERARRNRQTRQAFEERLAELTAEKARQAAQAEGRVEVGAEPETTIGESAAATSVRLLRDATSHHRKGRTELAIAGYDRVLEQRPEHIDAMHLKGAALAQAGRMSEAVTQMIRAFQRKPERRTSPAMRRRALEAIGAAGEVASAEGTRYRESKRGLPPLIAWSTALSRLGRHEDSLGFARHAAQIDPTSAPAQFQCGAALEALGKPAEALACFERAVALDPKLALGYLRISNLMNARGDWAAAVRALERVLALQPDNAAAIGNMVMARRILCDWRDERVWLERLFAACERSAKEGGPAPINPSFAQNLPFRPGKLKQLAGQHARRLFADLGSARAALDFSFAGRALAKPRLRIGYLSEGFRDFPTSHLIQRLFAYHDRAGFEIFAYSYGPDDGSPYRRRIAAEVDRFVDVCSASDREAARQIHEDGIDILVDLKGYTVSARPRITALRPAPVQVSYLGYPGTWGCSAVDYLLVDRVVVPAAEAGDFTETLVHLPNCYQVTDDRQEIDPAPQSRAEHGLPAEGFVFCCFNRPYKFDPQLFALWMAILREVPDSVLWLFCDNEIARRNLRHEAGALGVEGERLIFAERLDKPRHLARHRLADLFLDTRIYSAHTTGTDALWAGLPLIAWPTPSFHGRVAASLLTALGLPELIVDGPEAYRALAVQLARDPAALAALKAKLEARRTNCRLFDTARFARGLEAAYRAMWQLYLGGERPRPIAIDDAALG